MEPDQEKRPRLKTVVRAALIAAALGGGLFALSQVLAPQSASAETVHQAARVSGPAAPGHGVGAGLAQTTGAVGGLVTNTLGAVDATVTGVAHAVTTPAAPAPAPVAAAPAPAASAPTTSAAPVPAAPAVAPAASSPASSPAAAAAPAAQASAPAGDSVLGGTLANAGQSLGATTTGVGQVVHAAGGLALDPVQTSLDALPAQQRQSLDAATAPVTDTLAALDASHPASATVGALGLTVDGTLLLVERTPLLGPLLTGLLGDDPASTLLAPAARGLDGAVNGVDTLVTNTLRSHPAGVAPVAGTPGPVASVHVGSGAGRTTLDALAALVRGPAAALGAHPAAAVALVTAALAAVAALLGGMAGLPALPFAPFGPIGLAAGSAGTAAGGRGSRGTTGGLAALPARDAAAPGSARAAHHAETDALPASPVSDHDSTPD